MQNWLCVCHKKTVWGGWCMVHGMPLTYSNERASFLPLLLASKAKTHRRPTLDRLCQSTTYQEFGLLHEIFAARIMQGR